MQPQPGPQELCGVLVQRGGESRSFRILPNYTTHSHLHVFSSKVVMCDVLIEVKPPSQGQTYTEVRWDALGWRNFKSAADLINFTRSNEGTAERLCGTMKIQLTETRAFLKLENSCNLQIDSSIQRFASDGKRKVEIETCHDLCCRNVSDRTGGKTPSDHEQLYFPWLRH